ncbi:MAG: acyltransferase [Crocinitomicaceae bacterium]|nr:acyltransferase [Crocinitomicaceae bacterium]
MNKRHLKQVEFVRALAALSVAVFHFSAHFTWSEQTALNFTVGAQGVEVFYLISGFIIPFSLYHTSYKLKNYFQYMAKRLIRLLPPYITTIVLIQIISIFLCTYLWGCIHDINFRQIAINVFFLADLFPNYDWINPIFATLKVELQFYILIGILFVFYKKWSFTFPLFSALLIVLGILTRDMDTVLINSPYFILGTALFFIKEEGWKWEYTITVAMAFAILLSDYYWMDLGAAAIGFGLLYFLPDNFKALNLTGKISYSYYLVHGLSGGWFLFFTEKSDFAIAHPLIMIIAALLVSWVTAFVMYWVVERFSLKFSKRIRYAK